MIDNDKNIAFWDENARSSRPEAGMFAGMLAGKTEFDARYRCDSEQEHFLRIFTPTTDMRILEVGSGGGRWGFWLSDKVSSYVGIDISPEMVRSAENERIRREISNVRFECISLGDFIDDQKFDLVYFSVVLQFMDDDVIRSCIEKADSMLGGDTKIIISRDSVRAVQRTETIGDYPAIFRTDAEYVELFRSAGYFLEYSRQAYLPKRFTGVASRLYKLPYVSYERAYAARELLGKVDDVLGNPNFLKRKEQRTLATFGNDLTHKFFKYTTRAMDQKL